MTCLLLEESTVTVFACVRSIYSNKIDNVMDRQCWQAPLRPLAGLWRSPRIFVHRKELDFGFAGFCALADSDARSGS